MSPSLIGRVLAVASALAGTALGAPSAPKPPAGMVSVGPGTYRPLYAASQAEREIQVKAFFLDVKPVTNGDFLAFVRSTPEWRRERVGRLFADEGYLTHWKTSDSLGSELSPKSPVARVSWFAAKAYCASKQARLPTEREWELAALASESSADGSRDPAVIASILRFYSQPATSVSLRDVGTRRPNFWGVEDLHGLVWEWVHDFGASLVSSDSREKGEVDQNRFCGASGADARDPADYASFMRVAFRSSLAARYTTARLGFRCARDARTP
jgi:formylglycine-generating enzyme required for sulfatase activity